MRPAVRISVAVVLGFALLAKAPAYSEITDPAALRVGGLYDVLLDTMKQAKQLGINGRYNRLAPVLSKAYDLASMSRIAVGPGWNALSPQQRLSILNAFTRMTVANYANKFDGFSGERFEILGTIDRPNGYKFVKTQIVRSSGAPVTLNYLMRNTGAEWKIIDVYLNGTISELASRRAEFGAILKSGGPDALVSSLVTLGDKLLAKG